MVTASWWLSNGILQISRCIFAMYRRFKCYNILVINHLFSDQSFSDQSFSLSCSDWNLTHKYYIFHAFCNSSRMYNILSISFHIYRKRKIESYLIKLTLCIRMVNLTTFLPLPIYNSLTTTAISKNIASKFSRGGSSKDRDILKASGLSAVVAYSCHESNNNWIMTESFNCLYQDVEFINLMLFTERERDSKTYMDKSLCIIRNI